MIRIDVPATSANLGSGFDSLGIALTMENRVWMEESDSLDIRCTGVGQAAGSLSGGNQQKVVIGRSLSSNPKLVILDEPTRGIDAAARADVYNIIQQLSKKGVSVKMTLSIHAKLGANRKQAPTRPHHFGAKSRMVR